MLKGLEYLPYEKSLREMRLLSLAQGVLISVTGEVSKIEQETSQCCPVAGQEAVDTNSNMGNPI